MIVVDSSIWIDYFNGIVSKETDWLDESLGIKPIIMGDIILAEVLQGFQNEKIDEHKFALFFCVLKGAAKIILPIYVLFHKTPLLIFLYFNITAAQNNPES